MKKPDNLVKKILVMGCLSVALVVAGCEQQGPAEKTGKKIDQATEKLSKNIDKAADNAGKKIDVAKDAVADKAQTAGDYLDDSVITAKVKSALVNDSLLHASKIEVTTVDGVVKLSGTVDQEPNIARAVAVVQSVDHVKSVQTELVVFVPEPGK